MRHNFYTFFIGSSDSGKIRRVRVPHYVVHLLALLAIVGGASVVAAIGSYSRMLWKVANYNALRREQTDLKKQYSKLQTEVLDANERLNSLQSLASEVAMTYGLTRFGGTPFGLSSAPDDQESAYQESVQQFNFLEQNATAVALASEGLRLLPGMSLSSASYVPSLWPVEGEITGRFGERLDPFSGEGAFHTGMDIASHFGDDIHATADGVVMFAGRDAGYGRLVIIDHGFGLSTWYAHLSAFATHVGMRVKRGDVIGYEGQSGRATAPHLHYEVRFQDTPVNPWRYLHPSNQVVASNGAD